MTGTSAFVYFNSSGVPTTTTDATTFIANNSISLNKIAQGSNCGFYVNNSYTNADISLYPSSNITSDTLVFIDYSSNTSISMGSLTTTNGIPYWYNGGFTTLTGTSSVLTFDTNGRIS